MRFEPGPGTKTKFAQHVVRIKDMYLPFLATCRLAEGTKHGQKLVIFSEISTLVTEQKLLRITETIGHEALEY